VVSAGGLPSTHWSVGCRRDRVNELWSAPLSGAARDAPPVRQAPLQYLAGLPPREPSPRSGLPHRKQLPGGGRPPQTRGIGRRARATRQAGRRPACENCPPDRTGDQHGGRRNGWHGLGEQHTHPATTPCPRAAVRRPPGWTGRNGSAGSRCPNRTPRPRRSPPGPQPATPSSPAPTRQRDRHRRVAAGESQLFERQRSTHPVLAERGRPVHQHLTGGAVLPAHPPCQPPLHRDPDLRELGQHPRPRLGAIRSLHIHPARPSRNRLDCNET
jgi:hypothetical protein